MGIKSFIKGFVISNMLDKKPTKQDIVDPKPIVRNRSNYSTPKNYNTLDDGYDYGFYAPVIYRGFQGEKTIGELGNPVNYVPNHRALRFRGYQAYLENDIVKTIAGKFFKYVVGTGLKMQSEPNKTVLEMSEINEDIELFKKNTEALFNLYTETEYSDYSRVDYFHEKILEAYKAAWLSGDCLIVLRVDEVGVNVQIIEGDCVQDPIFDEQIKASIKKRGNRLSHGIEINPKGGHVAYYVTKKDEETGIVADFERIPARGENTGLKMAWMLYGEKHMSGDDRGIPAITQILERLTKIDRFTEATVGSAEERAKFVMTVEHDLNSTGENPFQDSLLDQATSERLQEEVDIYALGEQTATRIATTTDKQVFNMAPGSKLNTIASQNEINFSPFYDAVFTSLCASVDIPPEVARQMYEQNFSSSRAALNGWDLIVKDHRKKLSKKTYKPFYDLWLQLEILKGRIKAPGYLKAMNNGDVMTLEAYSNAKFTGVTMAHIDPLKEVKAIVEMINNDLISREQAVEVLGMGEWTQNFEKKMKEDDMIPEKEPIFTTPGNQAESVD